jgi:hypothetical protein
MFPIRGEALIFSGKSARPGGGMSSHDRNGNGEEIHLPPPFMPSEQRIRRAGSRGESGSADPSSSNLDQAFIQPDEPVVRSGHPQVPEDFEEVMSRVRPSDLGDDDVVVTGMGDDPHLGVEGGTRQWSDPHLERLADALQRLTEEVNGRGEAGLKVREGMSRFEATLRAYCVGYLSALRDHSPTDSTPS